MNNEKKNTYVKKHITDALLSMLDSTPINQISICDLCDRADVGRASFYRNYSSKEDVVKEFATLLMKQWALEFESDPTSNLTNVFGSLFSHYKKYSNFYSMLCKQDMAYLILDAIIEKVGLTSDLSNKEAYDKAFFAYGMYGWITE